MLTTSDHRKKVKMVTKQRTEQKIMLVNNSKNLYSNRSKCTKNENFFGGREGFPSKKKFCVLNTALPKTFYFPFFYENCQAAHFCILFVLSKKMGKRLILISNFQNGHTTAAAIALYRFIVCIKTFYQQWLIAYALETFACWISVHFTMAKEFRWRQKRWLG